MGCCAQDILYIKNYIVWINEDNDEKKYYKIRMEKKVSLEELKCIDDITEAIKYLKKLKFVKTIIICSGSIFPKFIETFKSVINEFMICPKIIIFTEEKSNFLTEVENNQNLLINHPFYNSGGVVDKFEDLFSFLTKDKIIFEKDIYINDHSKLSELEQFNFEYISNKNQLIFPIFFQSFFKQINNKDIQKFNKISLSKYENCEISSLFEQLFSVNEVPYEIICKYWIRAYTYESNF